VIEVVVVGLGVAPPSTSPLLLLKERQGERVLPIGIGPLEAHAIAMPLQGVRPPRPMTHDVFADVIRHLGGHVLRIEIVELVDNTFHARLILDRAGQEHAVDIRPSDAVALAIRTEAPMFAAESVLDQAGILTGQEEAAGEPSSSDAESGDETRLAPFKDFIETLDLDDLGPGGEERA
jgi:bifunctional DNase/RNase